MLSITLIRLGIADKLHDKEFRKVFFRNQAADNIAISIRGLRNRRKKRQIDLANESGMLQSAISRIEQADYGNWSLKTLFRVADVLDARLRIEFDPIEEVIAQYKKKEAESQVQEQRAAYREPDVSRAEISNSELNETPDSRVLITDSPGVI
jgi:transcriptional regulator with XRE-family HTH domain